MNSSAQSGKPADEALSRVIEGLWVRFLPEIRDRVASLEAAASDAAAGKLTDSARAEAESVAHKLAGILGTFSLTRGTVLAREMEMTFSRESSPGAGDGERLVAIVAEIRAMVENRPSAS